jgi:chromosome segregation ATPase
MTKAGAGDWKTPLGYYERAIAELRKVREEFYAEIRALRELQTSHERLQAEHQATKKQLQNTKEELQETKQRLEKLENRVAEAQKTADSAHSEAMTAQDTGNTARSETESVKAGIENGSIVAHKAVMLQGKDDQHWMRFCKVDSVNHHCFQVWRSDNTWHHTVRVGAAKKLRD